VGREAVDGRDDPGGGLLIPRSGDPGVPLQVVAASIFVCMPSLTPRHSGLGSLLTAVGVPA